MHGLHFAVPQISADLAIDRGRHCLNASYRCHVPRIIHEQVDGQPSGLFIEYFNEISIYPLRGGPDRQRELLLFPNLFPSNPQSRLFLLR